MKYIIFLFVLLFCGFGCGHLPQDVYRKKHYYDPNVYMETYKYLYEGIRRQENYQKFIIIDPNIIGENKFSYQFKRGS